MQLSPYIVHVASRAEPHLPVSHTAFTYTVAVQDSRITHHDSTPATMPLVAKNRNMPLKGGPHLVQKDN